MKFRKTEKAYWTIVYHEGKRIAEFVKGEFETDDEFVIEALQDMGYQNRGRPLKSLATKQRVEIEEPTFVDIPKEDKPKSRKKAIKKD